MAVLYFRDQDGKFIPIPALRGLKGDSPVRGVDYWTEDDIIEIKNYVDSQSDIHVGNEEPTKPSVKAWIDPDGEITEPTYELIETITLEEEVRIDRSAEPDGTPYNFESLLVKMIMPPELGNTNAMNVIFQMGDGRMVFMWMDGVTGTGVEKEAVCELLNVNGVLRSYRVLYTDEGIQSNARMHYPNVKGAITRIWSSDAFKATQTVEIWGVRV